MIGIQGALFPLMGPRGASEIAFCRGGGGGGGVTTTTRERKLKTMTAKSRRMPWYMNGIFRMRERKDGERELVN